MIFKWSENDFENFYQEHQSMVRGLLYNMTSEATIDDLVQESFIKIWQKMPLFQFNSSVKTWIYRITINTAIDHLRKQKKVLELKKNIAQIMKAHEPSLMLTENQRIIQKTLMELPEDIRSILVLYYFEDLSIHELSRVFEVPEGTVKSRLSAARLELKEKLILKGVKQHELI